MLPQKVPAPLAETVVGKAFTVIAAALLLATVLLQPPELVREVTVIVVAPELVKIEDGTGNEPLVPLMVKVLVYPDPVLAPDRLKCAVKLPEPSDVEFTVSTDPEPIQGEVAEVPE